VDEPNPLLDELESVCNQLAESHRLLGDFLNREHEAKVNKWLDAYEATRNVTHAGKVADHAALDMTREIYVLRSEIEALSQRRVFLVAALHA
jgi:hypothetical protein